MNNDIRQHPGRKPKEPVQCTLSRPHPREGIPLTGASGSGGHVFFVVALLVLFIVALLLPGAAAASGTLCVGSPDGCSGEQYATIQAAITAANPGDTIVAGPGLYDERITINKPLTLRGATAGISKKGYPVPAGYAYDAGTESVIAPQDTMNAPVVTIEKGDVTFDGFIISMTVAGSYPPYAPTELVRMTAGGNLNNVRIENNVIGPNTNLTHQDGNAGRMGITVSKWSPGTGDNTVHNLQIRNNKIFDAKGDGCGILMIGARNISAESIPDQFKGAVIDNNEISGNHRSGIDFSGGVRGGPDPADHIRITSNLITGNGWNSTVDRDNIKWGNGIAFLRMTDQLNAPTPWGPRYIDIENNEITGNEKNGVYLGPIVSDIAVHGNTIAGNGAGTSPDGAKTGYNTSWDGIRIDLDETYQIEELARHPGQGTYSGLTIHDYLTGITIDENRIHGNGGYGLRVIKRPQQGTIDAERNFWGDASGPLHPLSNPAGTGDEVSDNVECAPWYLSDDFSLGAGTTASGSGAVLVVSPENFTTIQQAINAASPGNTIQVFPGLYDERIVINRSVTLLGATYGIPKKDYTVPAGYAYDQTRESIVSPSVDRNEAVIQVRLGQVTLDGFVVANTKANQYPEMLYPYTDLIALNNQSNNYTGVRLINNVIGPNTNVQSQDGTKGRSGIVVTGPSSRTVDTLTIADNRIFDAKGDGCGILLLGSINTSAAPGLPAKYAGSVIDNNTIAGNHRSGIEFAGGVQGGPAPEDRFRITNNTIADNGWRDKKEKDQIKYGNGIILIHVRSDSAPYNPLAWGSRYLILDNNRISDNEKNGIYLGPVNRDIAITNNTISDNGRGGSGFGAWDSIRVDLDEVYHDPPENNHAFLTGIVIARNRIAGSGDYGLRVIGTPLAGPVDARLNWWDDASGPKGPDNPSAKGDRVSNGAAFSPWYKNQELTQTSTDIPRPIVSFDWSPFEAMAGEEIAFNASATVLLSATGIQSCEWKFGDGNTTTTTVPHISHAYEKAKVHWVTLSVTDLNGATNATTRDITIIGKRASIPLAFNGTTTTGGQGNQKIVINLTNSDGEVANTTTELSVKNPGNGWAQMVVKGNTSTSDGSIVIENITEVVLTAAPTVTALDTTPGGVGEVTTALELSLKEFVDAPLQIEVTEGANATVSNAFQLAAGAGSRVDAVAYTMTIRGSSLINSNLSASGEPVKLNMSVSREWVDAHGGISAIRAIRYSDDGTTRETLETNYLFTTGTPAMSFFEIISPNGCSIFGIAAISAVSSPSQGYPGGGGDTYQGSGYGTGGGSDSSSPPAERATVSLLPTPAEPVPDEEPVAAQPSPPSRGRPRTFSLEPAGIPVYDDMIIVLSTSESLPARLLREAFALVGGNIAAITGAVALGACVAFAVIWYGDRQQFWR